MWSLQRSGDAEPGLHELHHHATHEHEEWKERCRQSGCKTHKATILKQFDPKALRMIQDAELTWRLVKPCFTLNSP